MHNPRYFYTTVMIVSVITLACLLMAGPMRQGLPVAGDLPTRLAYIQQQLGWWQFGWLCWMAAALGLFTFACLWSSELPPSPWRQLGLSLLGLGLVPDLTAETIYGFVLPALSAEGLPISSLQLLDSLAMQLTGFLGNGLYNLGGLMLTVVMWRQRSVHGAVIGAGFLAWSLGLGLSAAIALNQLAAAELLTGSSMVLSCLWMLALAYQLWGRPPHVSHHVTHHV